MQPKFTQRKLWYFSARMVTMFLFLAVFSQLTFAQELRQQIPSKNLMGPKTVGLNHTRTRADVSIGPVPANWQAIRDNIKKSAGKNNNNTNQPAVGNPTSRAFCYEGFGPFQLRKHTLLSTTFTSVGGPSGVYGFPGASAWVTNNNKLYVVDQLAPFGLYTVDTVTGATTFVANCTGVPFTNLSGMTWDLSTSTMYGIAIDDFLTTSQIFKINIATGVCTLIGSPNAIDPGAIMINAAPGGTLFSIDLITQSLYRWNKTTGVPTLIGPVGFGINFGQDGHFDLSDGKYYWACFNSDIFTPQLRVVDTLTGSSAVIGNYATIQVQTLGIYAIPPTACSGTPSPGNTVGPASVCNGASFSLSLQNNPFVSGFTYQWQSSVTGVPASFVNIPGATTASIVTSQAGPTYYRCIVTCTPSGQSAISNPLQVADGQGIFTSQPASTSILCGGNATFSFTATGLSLTYAWQTRANASSPWTPVTNTGVYTGATTNTLTITNADITYNGRQYRGLISGPCTAVDFSSVATLTVTPQVATVSPTSATICQGSVQQLTLTSTLGNINLFSEGFEAAGLPAGWFMQNNSTPIGTVTDWVFGSSVLSPAQNGSPNSYALGNFNNVAGNNTISNWLLTPNVSIKNGDRLSFWTRTVASPAFPDRMEVRMSTNGASTNVGGTNASVGDFTNLLLTINPSLTTSGYPSSWTQYTVTVSGLGGPASGRFAFRYFVTNGGPAGANSDNIGVDNVVFTSTGGPALGIWSGPAGTMWTNAGATIPYTGTPITSIYVNPLTAGITNYSVFYNTLTPCTSTIATAAVNVIIPISGVVAPVNRAVCVGSSASFSVSASGGPLTYQWQVSVNSGVTYTDISGETAATLSLSSVTQLMNNNLYRCIISAGPCASSTTAAGRLTVNQLPIVTISSSALQLVPGGIATLTGSSSPAPLLATSWAWTKNGSAVTTSLLNLAVNTGSIKADIDNLGTYKATVTDINGCVNSSNNVVIGGQPSDRLWIYPNPNIGQFQVRLFFNGVQGEKRIVRVYNMLGEKVAQKEFALTQGSYPYVSITCDFSLLAAGTYVVKVADKFSGKITSGLVVIQ
jgi:Secretion system C-terminal sorting domain/Cleaved Adhesin Domain